MADRPSTATAVTVPVPLSLEEPFEVTAIERRTPTIAELWLTPRAAGVEHLPGEYILLEDERHEVAPRSYSIANAARPDGRISLLVTRVTHGETSRWIHDRLCVGDTVSVSGPYGAFVDDPVCTRPALFLAAGSGLAPIRALLEAGIQTGSHRSLTLIFSARTEAEVIDRQRFERWQLEHPRFRFIPTLTRSAGVPARGRIPSLLPTLYAGLSGRDVFIAGAPAFVQACATAVDRLGARPEHVHTETFFVEPRL